MAISIPMVPEASNKGIGEKKKLWPCRGDGGHFWLVDPWSGSFFDPATARFLTPIGLEHFFDAFALNHMRPLRVDAASAPQLPLEDVSDTLVVKQDRAEMYHLTPIWVPDEPPAKRAKTAEVRLSSTGDASMTPDEEECEQEDHHPIVDGEERMVFN